jgi:predicted nucleic acid-binding protein
MIVVADTSPLNYLVILGEIEVLAKLFGEVYTPPGVLRELTHPRTPAAVKQWAEAPPEWLQIKAASAALPITSPLDPGEAEAISLAIEMHAGAVLVDEKKGRRIAKSHGLATLGTLTVLELAAQRNLLDLKTSLAALQQTTFRISQPLIDAALKRDAQRKGK